jgi:hypothetical protein
MRVKLLSRVEPGFRLERRVRVTAWLSRGPDDKLDLRFQSVLNLFGFSLGIS